MLNILYYFGSQECNILDFSAKQIMLREAYVLEMLNLFDYFWKLREQFALRESPTEVIKFGTKIDSNPFDLNWAVAHTSATCTLRSISSVKFTIGATL